MGFVPEYEEYKEQISEFLASYILPYAEKCEKQKFVDRSLFEKLQEKAFWALMFPKIRRLRAFNAANRNT